MATLDDARNAKLTIRHQLLQLGLGGHVTARRATLSVASAVSNAGRNVHAIGIGRKAVADKETTELCVCIYVVQKLPESLLSPRDVIPSEIDGVPTDIIESDPAFVLAKKKSGGAKKKRAPRKKKTPPKKPTISAAAAPSCSTNRRQRQRPVVAGISAAHRDVTAGTITCFCRSTRAGDPAGVYALSNNHVFADVNSALIGDPLYQPSPADGALFGDHFANLHRFVPIQLGGTAPNNVDAALGLLLDSVPHTPEICSIGSISGTMASSENMLVRKHGRTTGYTEGKITSIDLDAIVGMDHNDPSVVALFEDQIRIETTENKPFGLGGDSGSAIVHRTQQNIVGLYFAGPDSGLYGIASPIQKVMTELQIAIP